MYGVWKLRAHEDDSGEDFTVPQADPKVNKKVVAYLNNGPFKCGDCNMYYHDEEGNGRCTWVKGEISGADGSCNFWADRLTQPIKGKEYDPPLTKDESGYVEHTNGTSCSSCKMFKAEEGKCEMVLGEIYPNGCCNGWLPNEEAEDSMISEANYKKIFKFYGKIDL